jgi:TRAP-type C4-dicarboxylate transport system substrate-binding protein
MRAFRLLLGLAVAVSVAGAAEAQTKWDLPSAYPKDNFHTENLAVFAENVARATGGKLTITIRPNASLFAAPEIMSAVRINSVPIGEILMALSANEDAMFGIDVVPFLATSYADAGKLWKASRPAIEERLAADGMVLLFAVPWPPQGVYAKKAIQSVADMKGLFWRTYNAQTERIGQLVGAYPVRVQAADLPKALTTGFINAFMTSSATGYDSRAWETMTHFYDTQAWIPKNMTFVRKDALDKLDPAVRQAVLTAATAAETRGWQVSQEKNRWYMSQLSAKGMKVLQPSEALRTGLKKVGEQLTAEWLNKAGSRGFDVLTKYQQM